MAYQPLTPQQIIEVEPIHPSSLQQQQQQPDPFHTGFQDIPFDPNVPPITRTAKHAPQWSSSTNTTITPSEKSSLQPSLKAKLSHSSTWTPEIITLAIGLASVAAIIGVIARYNGRALPEWPHDITLNALIALLATVANAAMSVTLSSGISQAKWVRFGRGPRPLVEMDGFDEASRGGWGAVKLLVSGKGGYVYLLLLYHTKT
jgi:hypothetical protein